MSKSVLCAIDISSPGEDAEVIKRAAQIAKIDNAQLDIVTVLPDFGMSVVGSFFDQGHAEEATKKAKKTLNEEVANALGADSNDNVRHIVVIGKVYDEVLKVAKEAKSDLIIVGAHKPDFKDYLLGPNAARIVRHSNCSVYVVR
jgi:nucleotide-binding universal stress UspA family protein